MTSNNQETRQLEQSIEGLLRGLEPPLPPAELRSQVLTPALQALQRQPVLDLWTRLWRSRPLRLAWTAVTATLVLAHLAVSVLQMGGAGPTPALAGQTLVASTDRVDEELAEVVQLPRLRIEEQPLGGLGTLGVNNNATDIVAATTEESSA